MEMKGQELQDPIGLPSEITSVPTEMEVGGTQGRSASLVAKKNL